ncbi:hypothetical protein PNEG_02170 [Pneumocystis murina B123]|uniref:J domain-containing protein n=1 Tax=Pneumocystis murina (strain B123) TaxID=1069680 RepID=M7P6S3_PNEMU|nr:hypothetical protein PNEG_02170 [Pneumocystis murina B123]EMR09585.1 hypothetical protein PNEG_02170 [Pneumocystis murina B123]
MGTCREVIDAIEEKNEEDLYELGIFKAIEGINKWEIREIEGAGSHFLKYAEKKLNKELLNKNFVEKKEEKIKFINEEEEEEEDLELLRSDPKEWKQQDHYAILGLSKSRYKATLEEIKQAYRQKVLKHHPDKKAAQGNLNDDSFFKCIQKAMEILSDPIKRRQYDSVDEKANICLPSKKDTTCFYKQWNEVFESEARFSNQHPVPSLGNEYSTKEEVEKFYNFWYNFDSWRSFEYLDKDIPDDSYNRNNKRYQERKNKADRTKRKTEDTARLRALIDTCLSLDPRIKKFKQEEKAAKAAKKQESRTNAQETHEKLIKEEEERKKKEMEEQLRKEEKKAKEIQKKAIKKNKKIIKQSLKTANYFYTGENVPLDVIDNVLADAELILQKIPLEQMTFTKALEETTQAENIHAIFKACIKKLIEEKVIEVSDLKVLSI